MLLLVLFCIAITTGSPNLKAEDNKPEELTELQKLKAENFQLKIRLAQLTATLADRDNRLNAVDLTAEQSKLVEEFRKQLNAKPEDVFDWEKLNFKPLSVAPVSDGK